MALISQSYSYWTKVLFVSSKMSPQHIPGALTVQTISDNTSYDCAYYLQGFTKMATTLVPSFLIIGFLFEHFGTKGIRQCVSL